MLYRLKKNVFYRRYEEIGYIVNKWAQTDRVVNLTGAVFLEVLSKKSRPFDQICAEVSQKFNAPADMISDDLAEFYGVMEQDGFIVSGQSDEELDSKDKPFYYANVAPVNLEYIGSEKILRSDNSTQEVLSQHFREHPHLVSMQIEITTRCNERCVHCYIPHPAKTKEMDMELFESILRQANEMGVLSIALSGGEPMSHSRFKDMLRLISGYDFSLSILSDLTLLDDETVCLLKEARISEAAVSLYSMDPQVHDSITLMPGSHEKTLNAIYKLIETEVPVQINCQIMQENCKSADGVLDWAAQHKIHAVTDPVLMARYDLSSGDLDHRISLDQVREVYKSVLEKDGGYRAHVEEKKDKECVKCDSSDEGLCGVCVSGISVRADGTLCPCAGWQSYILGDLNKDPLEKIWKESPNVLFLRKLRRRDFPECMECEEDHCSICMARNANESPTGNMLEVNKHYCKVAKINRALVEELLESLP
ncbi:MAG: radical SAM protein [Ruminococcus sp.]|nr:radical SAM protein [Ruminococcus sp.]